tara:strand:- start:3967 stop:4875 length:909 start_codon:yes stop_codon:yes gene_type:complete
MSKPTITTSYSGESAKKYIAASLLEGTTLANGGMTIMPNVKHKSVIQKVDVSGLIANATCDFSDAGTVAISERVITLEEFQVNVKFCTKQFVDSWESAELGASTFKNMPSSFGDFIIGNFADQIAASVENSIWQGGNSTAGQIDGFETLWAADSDIVDVTAGTVTSSNVIAELGKILDAAPNTVYGKEDLTLYVSRNMMKAYVRALAAQGGGYENRVNMWYDMNTPLSFDGIPLFLANGLSDNTAALAQKSNLYFGTNLVSDMNEVRVIDTSETLGDQNARFVSRFAYGIQYGYGAEIVFYS